jgi:hypothetical protein
LRQFDGTVYKSIPICEGDIQGRNTQLAEWHSTTRIAYDDVHRYIMPAQSFYVCGNVEPGRFGELRAEVADIDALRP